MRQIKYNSRFEGVFEIQNGRYYDERGWFSELYDDSWLEETGISFVKDNVSFSQKGTIRGLHFQNPHPQGKLVSVIQGKVADYFVDLRKNSKTFGEWGFVMLDAGLANMLYVPEGFAHGFVAVEDSIFHYKCTDIYSKESEKSLYFFDEDVNIALQNMDSIKMNIKDLRGKRLKDFTDEELF